MTDPVEEAIAELAEASRDMEKLEWCALNGKYISAAWADAAWQRWLAGKARLTQAAKAVQRDVKHGVRFDPIDLRKVYD